MTNDFINDQLSNLVANLIWLTLGVGVTYLGRYAFIVLPAKRLWGYLVSDKITICTATTKADTGEYLRPSTGIGQVRALAFVITSLNKAYKKVNFKRILLSDEEIKHHIEDDLLLLGGPKNNQITKLFFEKFDFYNLLNQAEDGSIYWQKKNIVYKGETRNGKVTKDYGLVIKMKNPFASTANTKLILFSGCHTYGTIAAAKYFCESVQKQIHLKKDENVAVLVSCDVVDGYPVSIKLADSIKF